MIRSTGHAALPHQAAIITLTFAHTPPPPPPSPGTTKTMLLFLIGWLSQLQASLLSYGKVYEKRDLAFIIKKYNTNALRLICYNFRTVNAINFLFSTLHTAPFLYDKIQFGVLHLLHVSIATFDTPLGSNPP